MKKKIVIAILICLSLTGCAKPSTDLGEQYKYLNETKNSTVPLSDLEKNDVDNPNHESYTVSTEDGKYQYIIDAEIDKENLGKMKIYEVNSPFVTEEYLIDLAKKIFDNGEYKVVVPYELADQTQLEGDLEYIEAMAAKYPERDYTYDIRYMKKLIRNAVGRETYIMRKDTIFCPMEMDWELLSDSEDTIFDYNIARIEGLINGERYAILYDDSASKKTIYVNNVTNIANMPNEENFGTVGEDASYMGENGSDKALAQEEADKVLKLLNLTDFEVYETRQKIDQDLDANGDVNADWKLNGYDFIYTRRIGGVQNITFENNICVPYEPDILTEEELINEIRLIEANKEKIKVEINNKEADEEEAEEADEEDDSFDYEGGIALENLRIVADKNGLRYFMLNNLMEISESLNEEIVFMDYSKIREIAKKTFEDRVIKQSSHFFSDDQIVTTSTVSRTVHLIKLAYAPVVYKNKIVLMPTWMYIGSNSSPYLEKLEKSQCMFGINAIDGSLIYFQYDFSSNHVIVKFGD